ncbi:MAG: transposase family protein [Chloroflexi bacterium]|nr:transposase family protein [Chloroflexota bacterium]
MHHGIPSHDTFGDVFARLDPVQLQDCFVSWTLRDNGPN